jgi:glutaredoxin 3
MTPKRKIEVFSAGCSMCRETIEIVQRNACESCEVKVLDMNDKVHKDIFKKIEKFLK